MNDMNGVIRSWLIRAAFWSALFASAANALHARARSQHTDTQAGGAVLAFLSGSKDEAQRPTEETPPLPTDDSKNFDGAWTFTSAGCPYTGRCRPALSAARLSSGAEAGRSTRMAHCIRSGPETA